MQEKLNVLIACEESQRVCKEFRNLGHEAYSCDLQDETGGYAEWHIKQDCLEIINGNCDFTTQDGTTHNIEGQWDLLICHPPCTYLTNGGAVRMFRKVIKEYPPYGTFQMVNVERLKKRSRMERLVAEETCVDTCGKGVEVNGSDSKNQRI